MSTFRMVGHIVCTTNVFFWATAYLLILRRGNLDQTPGMPLAAFAANLAWEGIFTFIYTPRDPKIVVAFALWFVLDLLILRQIVLFGRRDLRSPLVQKHWGWMVVGAIATAFIVIMGFTAQFKDYTGWYIAFLQNVMMSILFVGMIIRRDGIEGQSIYIALAKLIGTFFAFVMALRWSPAFGPIVDDWLPAKPSPMPPLIAWMYPLILVFDVIYVGLVYRKSVEVGLDPWRRL